MRDAGRQSHYERRSSAWWRSPVLLVAGLVVPVLWFVHAWHCWDDPGYVHLEFARSVASGRGFQFSGQVSYGDSAPLWVWLLAGMHAVVPNWIISGKVLAGVAAVLALAGLFQFARELTRGMGRERSVRFAAAMLLLMAVNPVFGRWAFTGTEAIAAAALAYWGLFAASGALTEPIRGSRLLLGCACAGAAPLLRPEMLIFTALLGFVLFVRWVNMPLRFGPKLALFFAGVVCAGAPAIGWSLYALHAFGTVVPNLWAASVCGPGESSLRESVVSYGLGFPVVLLGVLVPVGWYARESRLRKGRQHTEVNSAIGVSEWLTVVWTALTCAFVLLHHAHVQTRYVLVSAPALMVALLALAQRVWPRAYRAGLALGVVCGLCASVFFAWPAISAEAKAERVRADLASFVQGLPKSAAVAAEPAGELAFLSGHRIADMSGMIRPDVLAMRNDASDDRRVWWVHEQGAQYLVLDHAPEPGAESVWSRDMPAGDSLMDKERSGALDVLTLWKLPPSPTLPVPAEMPSRDEP